MPAPSLAAETLDLMPRVSPQNAVAIEAALDRFLRGVERRAYRHAQLACRQHEDALDVVQEAMLAFVRRYRQHPSTDWPLLFWRVLDSKLVDLQRRRSLRGRWFGWLGGRVDEDSEEDPFAHIADPAEPGPLGRLGDSEAAAALDLALRALPLRQRQAFLLRVWEGFDVAQTAQALGISEGSVKTHLFRALQSLRARLENHL